MRDNILDKKAQDELNQRYNPGFVPGDDDGYITLCTHNAQANRMNESKLKELPSKEKIFTAQVEGNFPEYSFPTDYELRLKSGAQVMFVKNDPDPEKRFFNGKIGQVSSIEENSFLCNAPEKKRKLK